MISRLYGEPGGNKEVDPQWIGWNGERAHPRSPAGGGGPGHFSRPGPVGVSSILLAQASDIDPRQRRDLTAIPLQNLPETTTSNKNSPPITKLRKLKRIKFVQNKYVDVEISAEVVKDDRSSDSDVTANTSFQLPPFSFPGFTFDNTKKITSFTGKFVWKGRIRIQTIFGPDASASSLSGYGRGTTKVDIGNGDITLGFHESCHQSDYLAYLSNNPLPDPPNLIVGMEKANFESECKRFENEYHVYQEKMELDSKTRTDEVGYTLTEFKKSNKPFQHSSP